MERIAIVLILLGLVGCGLQVHQHDDPWRSRLRACGSYIGQCGSEAAW